MLPAVLLCFAGVPSVDLFALDAGGLVEEAIGGEGRPVEDTVGEVFVLGSVQRLVQVGGVIGEHGDDLVEER
ncbi:MAG TPA: hypothetical protein VNO31_49630 [Umezawaea sp.]|nr:hypothetical protein [Umezawaea sp.]